MLEKQQAQLLDQTAQALDTTVIPPSQTPDATQDTVPQAWKILYPIYQAQSGLTYPERLPAEIPERVHLDLSKTILNLYQESVDLLDGEGFALIRRNGFGGSDSSVLLGVNPFTSLPELIRQKVSTTISEEELAIGNQTAVMKGNDLEPLIVHKVQEILELKVLKPTDMYVFKDFEYLKMNFDGVAETPETYFPIEVKVVTKIGEKHYNPTTPFYDSRRGFAALPKNTASNTNSIQTKAAMVGIPPYYYTQLQMEMMALNAPFGMLAALFENTWTLRLYFAYKDEAVQNAIKIEGFRAWQKVEMLKEQ